MSLNKLSVSLLSVSVSVSVDVFSLSLTVLLTCVLSQKKYMFFCVHTNCPLVTLSTVTNSADETSFFVSSGSTRMGVRGPVAVFVSGSFSSVTTCHVSPPVSPVSYRAVRVSSFSVVSFYSLSSTPLCLSQSASG